MKKLIIGLLLATGPTVYPQALAPAANLPKTGNSLFSGEMAEIMQHMKTYTLAIASQMPEDKFNFRPSANDTVRSFSEQLKHLIFNNNHQADFLLAGRPFDGPTLVKEMEAFEEIQMSKAQIINELSKSFDKLIVRLQGMTDSDFETQFTLPFATSPKSLRVMAMFVRDHITHHRAQLVVYLRINGIEPAFYRPF
jgi:uncharacterized damage-inducible protein DinB